MPSPARYIIHPGWIRSARDGNLHYITARTLMSLCQLNLHDPSVHHPIEHPSINYVESRQMKILDQLQLTLIVLKLCNAITWPWWKVMLPYLLLYGAVMSFWVIAWILILADHALLWIRDQLPPWLRDRLP